MDDVLAWFAVLIAGVFVALFVSGLVFWLLAIVEAIGHG